MGIENIAKIWINSMRDKTKPIRVINSRETQKKRAKKDLNGVEVRNVQKFPYKGGQKVQLETEYHMANPITRTSPHHSNALPCFNKRATVTSISDTPWRIQVNGMCTTCHSHVLIKEYAAGRDTDRFQGMIFNTQPVQTEVITLEDQVHTQEILMEMLKK